MAGPQRPVSPTLPPLAGLPGLRPPASAAIPAIDFGVRLNEGDIQPVSREGPAWTGTTVTIRVSKSVVENPQPDASGTASLSHDESLRNQEIPFDVQAHRKGPHTQDIEWTLRGGPGDGKLTRAHPVAAVDLSSRLRLSAWTQGEFLWDSSKVDRKKWDAIEGLDDVTLTQTVRMKDLPAATPANRNETDEEKKKREADDEKRRKEVEDDVDWADNFLPQATLFPGYEKKSAEERAKTAAATRAAFLLDAIQFFHGKRVQIFVGFEIVVDKPGSTAKPKDQLDKDTNAGKRFKDWLSAKGEDPADFANHAKKLVGFFDSQGLDIDGISYDIETSQLKESDRGRMQSLYMAVAAELRKKGRYLAYATGAFRTYDTKEKFLLEQPFSLATAAPDIIVRPMSYDVGTKGREDMFKFALTNDKLHPGQMQVAVTTLKDTSGHIEHADFDRECKDTWRRYRAGVIHWAMETEEDAKQLANHNRALNPTDFSTGRLGQPLQGPLNATRLKAFADAAQAQKDAQSAQKPGS